jgi:hypothetical protein
VQRAILPAVLLIAAGAAPPEGGDALAGPSVDLSRGPLRVSENRRLLLGDTAWELSHRLDRRQASGYLDLRAKQRCTVIQAVALAELDGLRDPNAYGDLPPVDLDPTRPAVTHRSDPDDARQYDYRDHVEFVVDEANRRGLHVGLPHVIHATAGGMFSLELPDEIYQARRFDPRTGREATRFDLPDHQHRVVNLPREVRRPGDTGGGVR